MPFVAFDGLDGAGKSCLVDMLAQELKKRGHDPLIIHHPTHDGLGGLVRKTLHVEKQRFHVWAETFFYAADLAQTTKTIIEPAIAAGRWVLAHRWWYSSVVYQAGIDGANWDDVREVSQLAVKGLTPTVGILVMADPEVACRRINARKEDSVSPYENLEHLKRGHFNFLRLRDDPKLKDEPFHGIDTSCVTPDESLQQVLALLRKHGQPVDA